MTAAHHDRQPPTVVHLIATNFFGGPERQILGYATHADPAEIRVVIASFAERHGNELLARAAEAAVEILAVSGRGRFDRAPARALRAWLAAQPRRTETP